MKGTFEDLFNPDGSLSNKMGAILRDCRNEPWVEEIYSRFGKTVSQKIYNVANKIYEQPKCDSCGRALKFLSFREGYRKECPMCKTHKPSKKFESTDAEDYEDIQEGKPRVLSVEEDRVGHTISSQILTTLDGSASEETLLKEHGLDPNLWKLLKVKHSIWQQFSNKKGLRNLYASKIEAAPRTIHDWTEEQIINKFNSLAKYNGSRAPEYKQDNGIAVVVPIADFHFGLSASKTTTGNTYNMSVAEKRIKEFLGKLKFKVKKQSNNLNNVGRVILTLGNDFFNADNLIGTTTKGTPQDQESDYYEIFDRGVKCAIDIITNLSDIFRNACIEVYNVQSNHDKVTSNALINCLYYKYADSKKVFVDPPSGKTSRFYLKVGQNLLGFGHETKMSECARLMSTEAANYWSQTKYRTFFIAHLHHEETKDCGPVTVRRLPILSGASKWANEQGYAACRPKQQVFVYSNSDGLTDILNFNIN